MVENIQKKKYAQRETELNDHLEEKIVQLREMLASKDTKNTSAYIAKINLDFQLDFQDESNDLIFDFKEAKREYVAQIKTISDEQEREEFFDFLWVSGVVDVPPEYESEEEYAQFYDGDPPLQQGEYYFSQESQNAVNREFAEYCIEYYDAIKFSDDVVNKKVVETLVQHDTEGFLLYFDQQEVVRLGMQDAVIDTLYTIAPNLIGEYLDRLPIQQNEQLDLVKRYAAEHPKAFLHHFNNFNLKETTREQYLLKMSLLDTALQAEPETFHNLSNDIHINKPHDRKRLRNEAEILVVSKYKKILIDLESRVDREKEIYTIEMTADEFAFIQDKPYESTWIDPKSERHISPEIFFLFRYGNTAEKKVALTPEEKEHILKEEGGQREKIKRLQSAKNVISVASFGEIEDPILNQKIVSEILKQIKFSGRGVEKYVDTAIWNNQEITLETLKASIDNGAMFLKELRDDVYKYRGLKEIIQDSFNNQSELGELIKTYMPKRSDLQKRIIRMFAYEEPFQFCKSIPDIGRQGIPALKNVLQSNPGYYTMHYDSIQMYEKAHYVKKVKGGDAENRGWHTPPLCRHGESLVACCCIVTSYSER